MSITAAVLNVVQNLMRRPNIYGGMSAGWKMQVFASKSVTFSKAGWVRLAVQSAGGSGAATSGATGVCGTGGNSGPWGVKLIRVAAGDVLAITIGAGGARPATSGSNGLQGGTTTVTLNGTTIITAQGGEGGVYLGALGTANAPVPAATITGCDFWVPGIRAGSATVASGAQCYGGGAASDVFQNGTGRSPNAPSGATASNGGTVGVDGGGAVTPYISMLEWGFATGIAGAQYSPGQGSVTGSWMSGPFGGGGGTNQSGQSAYCNAGIGAGGGAAVSNFYSGLGGSAYAFLQFEPTE